MKHCPNPNCSFLKEYKMVAEFNDDVELCRDCGTQLVVGEAPEVVVTAPIAPTTVYEPILAENLTPDLVMLCAVDSEADADFYKAQLEFQDIPVAIVRKTVATEDAADAAATLLFELQVRRSDLMRATYLLDTLDTELDDTELDDTELDDIELDAGVYDDAEDEEDRIVDPKLSDTDADDGTESALSPVAGIQTGDVDPMPTNRSPMPLFILIGVVVILVAWFLLSR